MLQINPNLADLVSDAASSLLPIRGDHHRRITWQS